MAFMERLQSKLILNTSLYHFQEAHLIEHPEHDFYEALKLEQYEDLEQMILNGFHVDYRECAITPPLIYAIMLGLTQGIELLLSYGASPNITNSHNQSALHIAIHYKSYEVIHLLLRHGAQNNIKDSDGITPLDLAQLLEDERSLAILKHTPAIQREYATLFDYAKRGDLHSLISAKDAHKNLHVKSSKGNTLLHFAALSRNKKLVCYLLNDGFDIDAENEYKDTPLTLLSRHIHINEMLEYLIHRHATLEHKNVMQESALILCIKFGNPHNAQLLIDNGADINSFMNINTPLTLTHDAISYFPKKANAFRSLEVQLLIKGAQVDVSTNTLRWTPLIQCATNSHTQLMLQHLELLITLGANVNYQDKNGRTALMLCATMHRDDAINILLKHYADVNIIDNFEWSALMFSCYYGNYDLTKLFLEYGADINFTSKNGNSALKIAKQRNNLSIVELLHNNGAIRQEEDD
jgi:ankyrin repeat protein